MEDEQLLRYSRQILLPQIDIGGQQKLLGANILIVGLGGLGSPAAMYLASAGVGHLILNDFDRVDLSNLQRQIIHTTRTIGTPKTNSAAAAIHALNPDTRLTLIDQILEEPELTSTIKIVDLVLDCSDNLTSRFKLNKVCVELRTPLVSGAAIRFEGQVAVFDSAKPISPCYNCLYQIDSELGESCVQSGVASPVPGIIGSVQALEAIKYLVGIGDSLLGSLLLFDGLSMEWRKMKLQRNQECPTCKGR